MKASYAVAATAAVACCWVGLVFGVSFLATVAKFNAPSLTLPVALDVGRHTFAPLARAEWALAILLAASIVLGTPTPFRLAAFSAIAAILLAQALWLLPALDVRVDAIIGGGTPPPSSLHLVFVAGEAMKLLLLLTLAVAAFRDLLQPTTGSA